jgi:Domain of unknown function (DUF4403)
MPSAAQNRRSFFRDASSRRSRAGVEATILRVAGQPLQRVRGFDARHAGLADCLELRDEGMGFQAQQTLRLADIQLAVESEAAFGLLGAAARAVVPQLQQALVQKATLDLKPIAANAREKIAAGIADYQKTEDGLRVEANIDSLTLADITFDSRTLRVIAEAGGSLNVYVTKLSGM